MILLKPDELVPGQVVARDVFNPTMPQMILLRAGHSLTTRTIKALYRFRSEGVWVVDNDLAPVDALVPAEAERTLQELVIQSYGLWTAMEHGPAMDLPVKPFEVMVEEAMLLLRQMNLSLFPWVGNYSGETFFGAHGAHVCLLALAAYQKADRHFEDEFPGDASSRRIASLLGLSALLHDIGNLRVPRHLLMDLDTLKPHEMEEVRLHTEHGYKILHDTAGPHVALAALHHHQNYDGTGYPKRRSGEEERPLAGHRIPVLARMVSLVDTYVTLTSERPYADPVSSLCAVRLIRLKAGVLFDPTLAQALLDIIPAFLPGRRVKLSNGYQAVIVGFSPDRQDRPVVRTVKDPSGSWLLENRREDLALSIHEDISIVSYEGAPVQPIADDQPLPPVEGTPDAFSMGG